MSIDLEDTAIINGADEFARRRDISESLEESGDPDISEMTDSGIPTFLKDCSTVSEESLERVLKVFSPVQPGTYKELLSEYNKLRVAIEREKTILTAKKKLLTFEKGDFKTENELLKSANESLQKENELLKSANESLQKENELLKSANESLQKENELLKSANESLQKENELLKSANESLQKENELLKSANESLQKENELLKIANESLQQKNVSLQQENERLVQDVIQKSEALMECLNPSKGGTLKRRKKRKVTKRNR